MYFNKIKELFTPIVDKIIILGAGEVGLQLAKRLSTEGKAVVVIDHKQERLDNITKSVDVQTLLGSGSSPSILKEAGISDATCFLAVTNNDEVNLVACLFANHIAPDAVILARINNQEYSDYIDILNGCHLNIHLMVNPENEVVNSIDRLLSLPGSQDFAQFAKGKLCMVAYYMENEILVNTKLLEFRKVCPYNGIMVAAIIRNNKLIIPKGNDYILKGDLVYFAFHKNAQQDFLSLIGRNESFFRSACIVGGGKVGTHLAEVFEQKHIKVKVIDNDYETCQDLAGKLHDSFILHGDATDKSLLMEEDIGKMDVIVAVTSDEETNILACLLAKNLGAKTTVARINKFAYMPIIQHIGIDHSVSTRLAAVNGFLNYLRRGNIVATASVAGDTADVIEARLSKKSPFINQALKNISLPARVILLSVARGDEIFIPNGETVFQENDHIIFLGDQKEIHKIDNLLIDSFELD